MVLSFGCGSPQDRNARVHGARSADAIRARAAENKKLDALPAPGPSKPRLEAWPLAQVPAGTVGPFLWAGERGGLSAWASTVEGERDWWTSAIGADGAPQGEPARIAVAPKELGLVMLRPDAGGRGYLLVYTSRTAVGESLSVLRLDEAGAPQGEPIALARVGRGILWTDVAFSGGAPIVFWADRVGAHARVSFRRLDGTPTTVVAPRVQAWQLAASGGNPVLGVLQARDEAGKEASSEVILHFIDAERAGGGAAAPAPKPLVVAEASRPEASLELVAVGENLLVSWAEADPVEPRVMLAAVGPSRKLIKQPYAPIVPLGRQFLVRLVATMASQGIAYLVWEHGPARGPVRTLQIAGVSADGVVGDARADLQLATAGPPAPEFAATPTGLAALTLAPACRADGRCDPAHLLPTYVEFDETLSAVASEPVTIEAVDARLAPVWSLQCPRSGSCFALAAGAKAPAPVFLVKLQNLTDSWLPVAGPSSAGQAPRVVRNQAIARGDVFADLAATQHGSHDLIAWLSDFNPHAPYAKPKKPAPDGRLAPVRAVLRTRELPDGKNSVISYRARSLGGVAAASAGNDRTVLAWTALDSRRAQVFLTEVDAAGKRKRQRELTRAAGEKSEVALARVEGGWIVAWVDERHGDPEIYAAKVDNSLKRVGGEQRITRAPGAASGPALLALDGGVLLVWSDSADSERVGWGDIWAATLSSKTAAVASEARKIITTRTHSHSPVLARVAERAAVAWIEQQPAVAQTEDSYGLHLAVLDSRADVLAGPDRLLPLDDASAVATAIECQVDRCRGVMSADQAGEAVLQAWSWEPGVGGTVSPLVHLEGPGSQVTSPTLVGSKLFVLDRSEGHGRVRELHIEW